MVSVISGIDVDDDGVDVGYQMGGGYHSALPLEVHGAGYKELTLISNAKAEKINKRCVKIQQNSLDVDWFCHEMAQKVQTPGFNFVVGLFGFERPPSASQKALSILKDPFFRDNECQK